MNFFSARFLGSKRGPQTGHFRPQKVEFIVIFLPLLLIKNVDLKLGLKCLIGEGMFEPASPMFQAPRKGINKNSFARNPPPRGPLTLQSLYVWGPLSLQNAGKSPNVKNFEGAGGA